MTTASIADPTSFVDERHVPFATWCAERAAIEVARIARPESRFVERYAAFAVEATDRGAAVANISVTAPQPTEGDWWYASGGAALAALHLSTDDDELANDVLAMVADVVTAFQIWSDLKMLPRDLAGGRTTYPIGVAAAAIGMSPAIRPFEVLGALVATGALQIILDTATERVTRARQIASDRGIFIFRSFIDDVARADDERRASLLSGYARRRPERESVSFNATSRAPQQAAAMAEQYLLSDLTFRESWETHREGMLGEPEVSSRFPAGLILEVLCRRGHSLGSEVDEFIAAAEENEYRYYNVPASDTDSDTIGVVLRLSRYASIPAHRAPAMQAVLNCIDTLVDRGDELPVWLTDCASGKPARSDAVRLGEGCATVIAHLLLGLAELRDAHSRTVVDAASRLYGRVAKVGLGANRNYPPRYALLTWFRLLRRVPDERVRELLASKLVRLVNATRATAQEVALTVICCTEAGRPELIDHRWMSTILKQQRFDGSWAAEPFAVAPNRGWHVSAYSSTTLTTALCYDAIAATMEIDPAQPSPI